MNNELIDNFRNKAWAPIRGPLLIRMNELSKQCADIHKKGDSNFLRLFLLKLENDSNFLNKLIQASTSSLNCKNVNDMCSSLRETYLESLRQIDSPLTLEQLLLWNQKIVGKNSNNGLRNSDSIKNGYLSFENIEEEITFWLELYNCRTFEEPLLFRAARLYRYFISIHPFCDGNGRLGRILIDRFLLSFNYPPAIYESPSDNMVAFYATGTHDISIEQSILVLSEGINNSASLLIEKD